MPADIITQHCDRRVQETRTLVDSIGQEPIEQFHAVCHMQYVVAECVDSSNRVLEVCNGLLESRAECGAEDYFSVGEVMLHLLSSSVDMCQTVQERAASFESEDFFIERANEIRDQIESLEDTLARVEATWPRFDKSALDAARESYKQGRTQTPRGILNEIRRSRSSGTNTEDPGLDGSGPG